MHVDSLWWHSLVCRLIPFDELQLVKKVGRGSFGTVWDARWRGARLAAKVLRRNTDVSDDGAGSQSDEIMNEIRVFALLSEVQHRNIIAFMGACSAGMGSVRQRAWHENVTDACRYWLPTCGLFKSAMCCVTLRPRTPPATI